MKLFHRAEDGATTLLVALLLPVVLLTLLGVVELGRVRVIAERARIAADLATVTAANDQDGAELARSGSLRPAADAERMAREQLAANLAPLEASLARTAEAVSAAAEVSVLDGAGRIGQRSYAGATVRIAADLPVRTPIFGFLLARPVTVVRLVAAATAR